MFIKEKKGYECFDP